MINKPHRKITINIINIINIIKIITPQKNYREKINIK